MRPGPARGRPAGGASAFRAMALRGAMLAAGFLLCAAVGPGSGAELRPAAEEHPFRVAFSRRFFGGVSDMDANAAVATWQEAILKPAGVPFDPRPLICSGVPELVAALQRGEVDAVAVQFSEYAAIPAGLLDPDWIYVNECRGRPYEQYVLLVARSSTFVDVRQLAGRSLIQWDNQRLCLAPHWLDLLLAGSGAGPAAAFFGSRTLETKPSKAVLPVFFGQADGCLVTRSSFEDMSELNPQVGRQLQVLAASPEIVPAFLCFRQGYVSRFRPQVEEAITSLHLSPAGKQVLLVFGCDRITRHPSSYLQSAWEILKPAPRRTGRPATAGAIPAPGLPRRSQEP